MSASVTASTEVTAPAPAFPIDWSDPADADKTWEWDDMHTPMCLTPLAGDFAVMIAEGDSYGSRRIGIPFEFRGQVFNGYVYYVSRYDVPDDELVAARERATALFREQIPLAADYWQRAVFELRQIWAWIASIRVEDLQPKDLAAAWEEAWARGLRAWQIHFYAIIGPYEVLDVLADLYESVLTDAPKGEALRLIQGTIHELTDVEAGMGRLSELAAASPELAAATERGDATATDLARLAGGAAFVAELDAFLGRHGHLGQNWDDLALPSFDEEPSRLLAEVAKRVRHPAEPAHERAARLTRDADELADAFRARVADDPAKLAEFNRVLATAREIGHITETHNYWIDRMSQARLRTLALRVGGRLAMAGVIDCGDDVFYLHRSEIGQVLGAPVDRRDVVAGRRAEHARWSSVRPPAVVGRPREDAPTNRFGGETMTSDDEAVLRGTGASRGVVTGPARLVLGPDDFERVRCGDVIVAPSSNPSWVPLFAIAGGLVTNTGGVLSHAAVVAREFDLPAVVGVADATSRIREGQTLEIDGTTGIVRLA